MATKTEKTEMKVLRTFAFVSVSAIPEGSTSIRDIFFCVVTSLLGKGSRFTIGEGSVARFNLASVILSAEAELQSFEFSAMQKMWDNRVF